MAIGDPTAPEDNERAIGGNLRNTGGRRPRPGNVGRRVGPRLKLPAEFAQFRLADGRFLGELMGDAFFGPASGSDGGELLSKRVRELLREGNSPFPGIRSNSPENFAPPATKAGTVARGRAEIPAAPPAGLAGAGPPKQPPVGGSRIATAVVDFLGAADDALLPAKLPDKEGAAFRARTGFGLEPAEGGFTLVDEGGDALFDLAPEDAAELGRIWSADIAGRVDAVGVLWREDLTPAEKRKLLAEAIDPGTSRPARRPNNVNARPSGDPARHLADRRLRAYDVLAGALESGAPDDELGELIDAFQAAMLPEIFGSERFFRELLMDVVPGLGNARSIRHLENDIAEVERAIETGEWGAAAFAAGMAVLDGIGILPGGNLLKAGGSRLAKGARGAVRPFVRHLPRKYRARWELAEFIRNAGKPFPPGSAEKYFAKVWDDLPPEMHTFLEARYKNFAGQAGEDIVKRRLNAAGFKLRPHDKRFNFTKDGEEFLRVFDHVTSQEVKTSLFDLFAIPKKGTKGSSIEVKVATSGSTLTFVAHV